MSQASISNECNWHILEMDIALGCWSVTANENGDSFIEVEGFHSRRWNDTRLSHSVVPEVFIAGIRIYKDRLRTYTPLLLEADLNEQGETIGTLTFRHPDATAKIRPGVMEVYMSMNMKGASWDRMANLAISGHMPPRNLRAKTRFPATRPHPEESARVQGYLIEVSFLYDKAHKIPSFHDLSGLVFAFLCHSFSPRSTTSTEANPLTNPQFQQILLELTSSALKSYNEDGRSLRSGFDDAISVALQVWERLQGIHGRNKQDRQSRMVAESDISEGWKKRSPQKDLALGHDSPGRIETSVDDFEDIAEIYFSTALRSGTIEYIIVDGLMYAELQAFSRPIIRSYPGARSYEMSLPNIPAGDWYSLEKIRRRLVLRRLPWAFAYWILGFIAPFCYATYAAETFGWMGFACAALWSLAAALLHKLFKQIDITGRESEVRSFKETMDLFRLMKKAYLYVSPAFSSEEIVPTLNRSVEAGAAWNALVFKIIRSNLADTKRTSPLEIEYAKCFRRAMRRWPGEKSETILGSTPPRTRPDDLQQAQAVSKS